MLFVPINSLETRIKGNRHFHSVKEENIENDGQDEKLE